MALVKLKISLTAAHGSFAKGEIVEWPDHDVPNLLRADYGELVQPADSKSANSPESAAVAVPEKAVAPAAKRRARG